MDRSCWLFKTECTRRSHSWTTGAICRPRHSAGKPFKHNTELKARGGRTIPFIHAATAVTSCTRFTGLFAGTGAGVGADSGADSGSGSGSGGVGFGSIKYVWDEYRGDANGCHGALYPTPLYPMQARAVRTAVRRQYVQATINICDGRGTTDGLFDRRGDRWGDPGHFVKSHSTLLVGRFGISAPHISRACGGYQSILGPRKRREPWCVTKIVKTYKY